MRAAREAGRDIPGDLSVVGFDDTPASAYLHPSLTTVRLDFEGLGCACFGLLLRRLQPEAVLSFPTWNEPELIARRAAAHRRPDAHPAAPLSSEGRLQLRRAGGPVLSRTTSSVASSMRLCDSGSPWASFSTIEVAAEAIAEGLADGGQRGMAHRTEGMSSKLITLRSSGTRRPS